MRTIRDELDTPSSRPNWRIPTPWPAVNDRIDAGVEMKHSPVMISSGDHHYASSLLRTWHTQLVDQGWNPAWMSCHRDRTSREDLLTWAETQLSRGGIIIIDWFPNVAHDKDEQGEALSDADMAVEMFRKINTFSRRGGGLAIVGACMQLAATSARGLDVRNYLCRGDGYLEAHAQLSMLTYPEPGTDAPMAWLYHHRNVEVYGHETVPLSR